MWLPARMIGPRAGMCSRPRISRRVRARIDSTARPRSTRRTIGWPLVFIRILSTTLVTAPRPFVWFTLGQSISSFGDKLHDMALVGLIGAIAPSDSPLVLAQLAVVYCLPHLIVTPLAGQWADRWPRVRTLIVCDVARAGVVALMPWAAASRPLLLALVGAMFVLTITFNVTKLAVVPEVVGNRELLQANAATSLFSRLATLLGIVLGGVIVSASVWARLGWSGYAAGFSVDALTFVISVLTLLRLPTLLRRSRPGASASAQQPSMLDAVRRDAREVLTLARQESHVGLALASSALLGLMGGLMYIVLVVVLQTRTSWGTAGIGYVLGLMAVGIVAGSAWVGTAGRTWHRSRIIAIAMGALALLLAAAARPFIFPLHGPLSIAAGLALGPMMIAQDTLLQERSPDAIRGRVFSVRDIVLNVSFGAGAAATGLAVTWLSRSGVADPFRVVLLAAAPCVLLAAAVAFRASRGSSSR
jgi:predicted MFS family arabinose efflux permease